DARWLMAYAAALGETDPRYFDTLAAGGPRAHPVFPVCYEWPAAVALRDRTVAAGLQPLGVHATHHLVLHRPPRAGDALRTVARSAGLPGPILHGTATLALAVSRVVRRELGGDPARVAEIRGRFSGMVSFPSTFTVRGQGHDGGCIAFDAIGPDGAPVLSQGV